MPLRDIIGHRKLVALLARSMARQSLPPSLILSGPSGVGKHMAALATAQALNCLEPFRRSPEDDSEAVPEFDACGVCAACTRIARGVHPDVLTLEPNDKGNIKIDAVRDVTDRSGYRPFEGRRRVTIVNQADALERSAQNAFLKVLEEPPSGSAFLLVTAHPDLLLPTVRSRCPQLRFRPLAVREIAQVLKARGQSEAEAYAVAATADGSIGRALEASATDVVEAREVAMRVLAQAAASEDARRRMDSAKELVVKGAGAASTERDQLSVYLRAMSALLRDIAAREAVDDPSLLVNPDLAGDLRRLSAFEGDRGRQAFQSVDRALAALERYTNAKLVADWLVLQL